MEIQVSKLNELLALLKPAINKRSTLPVTTFILLKEGKAFATDLETMVIADLPEAQEPMLLPFASIAEMLKYVPGNEVLKIEAKDKTVSLEWSHGSANYPTEDVLDFPPPGEMPVRAEGSLDGDALMAAMLAALPYAATNETRPVLAGVTLVLGSPIEVAAGDGFRMSHQTLGLSFPLEEKVIMPAHAVSILGHVFSKTPRTPPTTAKSLISVITAKRQLHIALFGEALDDRASKVRVDFGTSASVVVSLVSGNPPDFIKLIPKGDPILQSQLFAPQLEAAVKRVRDIAKGGSGIIRMVFADGKLTVSAKGEEQEITATMDTLNTKGEPGRTAIDYPYLLGYLSGKQGIIMLSQYDRIGPLVFQYQNGPKVLIMPMAVQWDDEKPPTAEEPMPEPETVEGEAGASLEVEQESVAKEPETAETTASKPTRKRNRKKVTA